MASRTSSDAKAGLPRRSGAHETSQGRRSLTKRVFECPVTHVRVPIASRDGRRVSSAGDVKNGAPATSSSTRPGTTSESGGRLKLWLHVFLSHRSATLR